MKFFVFMMFLFLCSASPVGCSNIEEKFMTSLTINTISGAISGAIIAPITFFLIKKSEKPSDYIASSIVGIIIGAFVSFTGTEIYFFITY